MIWRRSPKAASLLASCADNPPATRVRRREGLSTYHETVFTNSPGDRRVCELRRIHEREAERLWKLVEASGNYQGGEAREAWNRHVEDSEQKAIADAVDGKMGVAA